MGNKIVIYGMGQLFKKYEHLINKSDVVCYVDNRISQTIYCEKPVVNVEQLSSFNYDYIVVFTINYYDEIAYELIWNFGIDVNKIVLFQWYYNLGYNTKNLYRAFLNMMETANVKSILDVNNCIYDLGLWGISKKKDIQIDYIEKYDEKLDECECTLFNSVDKEYDMSIINGVDICQDEISVIVDRLLEKSSIILININNIDLIKNKKYKKINIQGYIFLYVVSVKMTIRIYQISHKPFIKYNDNIYLEMCVGKYEKPEIKNDKTGDNIANLNSKINEITGIYEIWKNEESNVIGINHYRRCFKSLLNPQYGALSELEINLMLDKYDVIVAQPTGPNTCSEKEDLRNSINKEAFDRCWNALNNYFKTKTDSEKKALDYVFSGQIMFPCNMLITAKDIFDEYCQWLMPIVLYLVDNVEFDYMWDAYSSRVIGFFAERLLTVWLYLSDYSLTEIPIQFIGNEGEYGK